MPKTETDRVLSARCTHAYPAIFGLYWIGSCQSRILGSSTDHVNCCTSPCSVWMCLKIRQLNRVSSHSKRVFLNRVRSPSLHNTNVKRNMHTLNPRPSQPGIKRKKRQLQYMSNINITRFRVFIFGII